MTVKIAKDNYMKKGIINTGTLITFGIGTVVAVSGFFAKSWFMDTRAELISVKQTQTEVQKVNAVQDTGIGILKTKVENIDIRTTRMEDKLDLLLKNQGIYYKDVKK